MQDYDHEETWTNEMENIPASQAPLDPNWGFGGAEAGCIINPEEDSAYVLEPYHQSTNLYSGVPGSGNGGVAASTQGWTQLGNPVVARQGMPSDYHPAPIFNDGYGTQTTYNASLNAFGAWVVGPASFVPVHPLYYAGSEAQLQTPTAIAPGLPLGNTSLPSQGPAQIPSQIYPQVPAQLPVHPPQAIVAFACTQAGCQRSFRRDSDRIRHEASKHGVNGTLHFCQIMGCPKSYGLGYTRKDKLTEHMWRKHADLGFVKRVQ